MAYLNEPAVCRLLEAAGLSRTQLKVRTGVSIHDLRGKNMRRSTEDRLLFALREVGICATRREILLDDAPEFEGDSRFTKVARKLAGLLDVSMRCAYQAGQSGESYEHFYARYVEGGPDDE
jgi:hypothetical protein